jgi:hypothetical protein
LIVGKLPSEPGEEPMIVRRDDGSWMFDGALDLDTVARTLEVQSLLSDGEPQHYHTLGGLIMLSLGRVPRTGDAFTRRATGARSWTWTGTRSIACWSAAPTGSRTVGQGQDELLRFAQEVHGTRLLWDNFSILKMTI